jgi:uncharacterized protein YkwD
MRRPGIFSSLLMVGVCCSAAGLGRQVVPVPFGSGAASAAQAPDRAAAVPPEQEAEQLAEVRATPTPAPGEQAPAAPAEPVTTPPAAQAVSTLRANLTANVDLGSYEDKASALLDRMNNARTEEGTRPLSRDADLDEVALARAKNLVANGYFDHYAPDGESAFSELGARGIYYRLAGENLARNNYGDNRTVEAAFDGLMGSAGHRANILERRFSLVGIAAVRSGGIWIYVTVFMD